MHKAKSPPFAEKGGLFLLWDMDLYNIRDFNTTRIFILHILYCFRQLGEQYALR